MPQTRQIEGSYQHTVSLITEMSKIQKSHPYIAGINIYYEATNTIVTDFDKVLFPASREQLDRYLPWYSTYEQMELKPNGIWTMGDAYLMEEPVIAYISRIARPEWHGKDIVLAIYISPESFSEYIDQKEGSLFITTQDNQAIYGQQTWDEDSILSEKYGFQQAEDLIVFHHVSPSSGLNYYYGIDSSRFYQDYDITSRISFFNFLISIVFNLLVLLLISYYSHTAYRRRVQDLSREAGIPIGDSDKSFDRSLHALTKEIITLHEEVDSSKGMMFQSMVRSVILHQKDGSRDEKIAPYLTRPVCCVVLLDLPQTDMETLPTEELQAGFPPGHQDYDALFATVDNQKLAVVLMFDDGAWERTRKAFSSEMEKRWQNYKMVSGRILPVAQQGIQDSYKSAVEAAGYQYLFTDEAYLSYEQLRIKERKTSGSHLKLFEAVRRDINNENLLDLKLHMEMLVTSFKSGNYTIQYCMSTLRDFVTLLYQAMLQNQLDMWVVFGYDIRDYYKRIRDIDVFQSWCDHICERILKNIHEKKQSVDMDMRTRILQLVEEHLEHDITLDLLADRLQIRPNGASRLFRQVMGTGYTEYIKTRKLDRAKELMEEGCSVKDTAERLGYSSAQYFIKVFKESYGITPYQYKKNQEKEKGSG